MKQTIKSAKMITMGLCTLCVMGLTNVAFAGANTENPVEVKYIGTIKNQFNIELNLNNKEAGAYFVNIKNMNYHMLYSEIVKGTNLSRIFKLNMEDDDLNSPDFKVRVEVTSEKTNKTEVYIISNLSGELDAATVTKL